MELYNLVELAVVLCPQSTSLTSIIKYNIIYTPIKIHTGEVQQHYYNQTVFV